MSGFNIHKYFGNEENFTKFKKRYLFCYNSIQTLGWSYILTRVLNYYVFLDKSNTSLYDEVQIPLKIFQLGAFLEYYHAKFKFTKSNPAVTFQQIYSRIMVVCAVLMALETPANSYGFPMLMFAWSITEIIRYSTYTLSIFSQAPYFLTWLRYTAFIGLYPLGVTGELLCMWAGASEAIQTRRWSMEFPNKWNVIFYYHYYLIFSMFLYLPFFPKLYLHMFSQRKKVLGNPKRNNKAE